MGSSQAEACRAARTLGFTGTHSGTLVCALDKPNSCYVPKGQHVL